MLPGHQFQNECSLLSSCSIDPTAWVSKVSKAAVYSFVTEVEDALTFLLLDL